VFKRFRWSLEDILLYLVAYLTLAAVAALGLTVLAQSGQRYQSAAFLLAAFGVVLAFTPEAQAARWKRHLYLTVQAGLVAGLLFLYYASWSVFPILYFILSAQAVLIFPRPTGALWVALFTLLTGGAFIHTLSWREGLLTALPYAGGYLFFGAFAHALARAEAAHRKSQALLTELQEAHRRLQEYAARVEELAVVEERNRLARELHDTLGHRLTVAAVQLEGAWRLIPRDPERAAAMVVTVREQVRQALAELRRAVTALRVPLEADLPLPDSLTRLATRFEEGTGITVHRALPEDMAPLPETHRLALYRAAQEALTNVQRHADAHQVWLVLTADDERVILLVGDDGCGFPPEIERHGFGLEGLRERVARLGGTLHLGARPGGGAEVRVSLPLPEEDDE